MGFSVLSHGVSGGWQSRCFHDRIRNGIGIMKLLKVVSVACLLGISLLRPAVAFNEQPLGSPPQSVTLAWSPSSDSSVTGYNLYYGRTFVSPTNRLDVGAALTATVTNLESGLAYFFYATAYDASGVESEPSNLITHTPTSGPSSPSDLFVKAVTTRSVSLRWQKNSTDLDGFYIERSLDGNTFVTVATVGAGATNHVFTDTQGFSAKTYPYWFRVTAFRGSSVSAPSSPATAVTNRSDLVITSVSFTPTAPVAGSRVLFKAVVRNQGTAATPQGVNVMVSFSVNGQPAAAWCSLTNSLAPGAKTTVTAQNGPDGLATWTATVGFHSVTATVDAQGSLTESQDGNNQFSAGLAVPLADAPVASLSLNKSVVSETDSVGAVVTVSRSGSTVSPLTVLLIWGGSARTGTDVAPPPPFVIIPGGSASITFSLKPIHNLLVSPEKTVMLTVAPDVDYRVGGSSSITLRISNQDVDSDGDGMSNAAEQLAGTAANNANSNLRIQSMIHGPDGQMTVRWGSVAGISYRVLFASSLENANWTPISPRLTASESTTSWTFTPTNMVGVYGLGF